MQTKYIFITGGVVSGLGKGITSASLGRLLKARGLKVTNQKFDLYINIDPGTISPYQHGEVFVTEDGAETDLDLGHYERFVDENLSVNSNITAGKVYWSVLNKERQGEYLGATIQVIPHITDMIKEKIIKTGKTAHSDIVITEIGGTVGDIEGLPFFEAIRQISIDVGKENVLYVHVTLIPYLSPGGELKSKPSQHSVKELLSIGIQPDLIVCRTEMPLPLEFKEKLALFCNVSKECVIQNMNAQSLYEIPLLLEEDGFSRLVCEKLGLSTPEPDLREWRGLIEMQKNITRTLTIALVGKYVELHDAYLSVVESLTHAALHNGCEAAIRWISAEDVTNDCAAELFAGADAMILPGGFGERGMDGIIAAAKYARESKLPTLGISLGMQCMTLEFAQNVMGLEDAFMDELRPDCKNPVICMMEGQTGEGPKGGTMRLGSQPCKLSAGSVIHESYNQELVYERHRHRSEFNIDYSKAVEEAGLILSAVSPDGQRVAAVELPKDKHPFYVGVQFHPEFKSRPNRPHPLVAGFVKAAARV